MPLHLDLCFALTIFFLTTTNGERVNCREISQGNGKILTDCVGVVSPQDLGVQNQYILWLNPHRSTQDQSLDISVPNYRVQDVIQAAAKAGDSQSRTNINVKLQPIETSFKAQKEDSIARTAHSFDVNLLYERLTGKSVHFADDGSGNARYTTNREPIRTPTNTNTRTEISTPSNTNTRTEINTPRNTNPRTEINTSTNSNLWAVRIIDLLTLMRSTFDDIGEIASEEDLVIGARINATLNGEYYRASQIFADYETEQEARRRFKRQTDPGEKAHDDIGEIAVGAGDKIKKDTSQLSKSKQDRIAKKLENLKNKCSANPCKNTSKAFEGGGQRKSG